jgi:hypothetical protein
MVVAKTGRPSKRSPQIVKRLIEAKSLGMSDKRAALAAGIGEDTFTRWRRDPKFQAQIEQGDAVCEFKDLQAIRRGKPGWQGRGWIRERLNPERYARPEVQIMIQQNNLKAAQADSRNKTLEIFQSIHESYEPVKVLPGARPLEKMYEFNPDVVYETELARVLGKAGAGELAPPPQLESGEHAIFEKVEPFPKPGLSEPGSITKELAQQTETIEAGTLAWRHARGEMGSQGPPIPVLPLRIRPNQPEVQYLDP